jgi:hypothetical protein
LDKILAAPVVKLRPTLVTVPPPPDVATQDVAPMPSVERTYPFVPAVVGSVKDHVPAAAAVFNVTVPDVEPDKRRFPAAVPATPKVKAPPDIVALAFPETAVPFDA